MQRYLSVSGDDAAVNAAIVEILSTKYGVTISVATDVLENKPRTDDKVIWPVCKPCGLRHQPEVTCEDNFQRKIKARAKFVSRQGSPKAPKRAKKSDKPDESGMSGHSLVNAANDDKSGQAPAAPARVDDSTSTRHRSPAALGPRFRRGDTFRCVMTNNSARITKGDTGVVLSDAVRGGSGFLVQVILDGGDDYDGPVLLRTVPQSTLRWTGRAHDQERELPPTKATAPAVDKAVRRLSTFKGGQS